MAESRLEALRKKYGENPEMWKMAGLSSLLGAELTEGASEISEANLRSHNVAVRQAEISNRSDASLANIAQAGKKVVGAQEAAFVKAGVKLEGSALDVIQETISQQFEAMEVQQRQADFEISQLEVERRVRQAQASQAQISTLLSLGTTAAFHGQGLFGDSTSPSDTGLGANTLDERSFRSGRPRTLLA
jgi:hypothetical protein